MALTEPAEQAPMTPERLCLRPVHPAQLRSELGVRSLLRSGHHRDEQHPSGGIAIRTGSWLSETEERLRASALLTSSLAVLEARSWASFADGRAFKLPRGVAHPARCTHCADRAHASDRPPAQLLKAANLG